MIKVINYTLYLLRRKLGLEGRVDILFHLNKELWLFRFQEKMYKIYLIAFFIKDQAFTSVHCDSELLSLIMKHEQPMRMLKGLQGNFE